MPIDDFTEEPEQEKPVKKGIFSRLDDAIQQHYNRKVAKIEANGGSRYNLAQQYLDSAKRWNRATAVNVILPISVKGHSVIKRRIMNFQSNLDRMKSVENDMGYVKDAHIEEHKEQVRFSRQIDAVFSSFFPSFGLAFGIDGINYLDSSTGYLMIGSTIGFSSMGMASLRIMQYSYVINADPNVKQKSPEWIRKLSELKGRVTDAIFSPKPVPVPIRANYSVSENR